MINEKVRDERFTDVKIKLKNPGSAITHGIAMLLCIMGSGPLIGRAAEQAGLVNVIALSIFMLTMTVLYFASTVYHSVNGSETVNRRLRKLDHMMIFIMIAGGYTPFYLIATPDKTGYIMCAIIWITAAAGMVLKALWITCPKWLSSVLYIGMGCLCLLKSKSFIAALPAAGIALLFAGGVCYIAGGIIYALKLPIFNKLHESFGSHEIFHVFIMMGSVFHYILMYCYLAVMPA